MEFEIRYISFYVIQVDGKDEQANKQYKHFQTLDTEEFENSELKDFLDGELKKNRQAESRTPSEIGAGADENRPLHHRAGA